MELHIIQGTITFPLRGILGNEVTDLGIKGYYGAV